MDFAGLCEASISTWCHSHIALDFWESFFCKSLQALLVWEGFNFPHASMSSNMACSSDGKLCTQAYPIRDYFLALFIIVVCLVCLRMLLYASYYTWIRISSRRQEQGNSIQPRRLDRGLPLVTAQSSTGPMPSSLNEAARVCVVPGEDRPTFIAMPAPLAPSRDMDFQVNMSVKTLDLPKN